MQEIDNIIQEIGDVNDLFFSKKISENEYQKLLKPIYDRLNQAIKKVKCQS